MTDHELLQSYVHHSDNDAMCQLVQRHLPMVHATALRSLGSGNNVSLADDIAQAVFLVLMRRAKDLSPTVILPGCLFNATLNAVPTARRTQRRRDHHEREAAKMIPSQTPHNDPALA